MINTFYKNYLEKLITNFLLLNFALPMTKPSVKLAIKLISKPKKIKLASQEFLQTS